MTVINAYFGNGKTATVRITPSIERSGNNVVTDTEKLEKALNKSKSKSKNAIAVFDWEEGIITLFDNGNFTGQIWLGRQKVNGTWEYM